MAEVNRDAEKTMRKLAMAANHYTRTCPAVSRHFMNEMKDIRLNIGRQPAAEDQMTCPFCSAIFRPGNYSVTLRPKLKMSGKVERLRRRHAAGRMLTPAQLRRLDSHERHRNQQVVRCDNCGHDDKLPGGSRKESVLVRLREDRIRQARKNKQMTQPKKGCRTERSLCDSGLPDSLTTTQSPSLSLSLSTISSSELDLTVSSAGEVWRAHTPTTSTPRLQPRTPAATPETFTTLLSTIQASSGNRNQNSQKKKTKKRKGGLGKLESMLTEQKLQESKKQKDSLVNFLSSV